MSVRTIKMKSISTKPQPQPDAQVLDQRSVAPEVKVPNIPVPEQHQPSISSSTASRIMSSVGKTVQKHGPVSGGLSHDGVKKHQEFVLMLSRYGTSKRFGSYLKDLSFNLTLSRLKKMTIPQLEDLLIRVRTSVANKNTSNIWENSISGAVDITEKLISASPLGNRIHIEGLAEHLKEDDTWLDLVEELQLEYQNLTYVSPQVRLTYTLLTVGAQVHALNTFKHRIRKVDKEPTDLRSKVVTKKPDEKIEKKKQNNIPIPWNEQVLDLDEQKSD